MPIARTQDIAHTERLIQQRQAEIADILIKHGLLEAHSGLKIRFGTELEFNTVAGADAAKNRLAEIIANGVEAGSKSDSYMPEAAKEANLDKSFAGKYGQRVRVVLETNRRLQAGVEYVKSERCEIVAYAQKELVSPPRYPLGAARWLDAVYFHLIKEAEKYDLKRVAITTRSHQETSSSSIHNHVSVFADSKNIFSAAAFDASKSEAALSEIAIFVGHASNSFTREAFPIFSPTRSGFVRFGDTEIVGPKSIRVGDRKKAHDFPSSMFRGAGRQCGRIDDPYRGNLRDAGPLRLELRVACPEAAGHANRQAYPELAVMPYELIEAKLNIILLGLQNWDRHQEDKHHKIILPNFSEEGLYAERLRIPQSFDRAVDLMRQSRLIREFYPQERIEQMVARYEILSKLIDLDRSPHQDARGALINRRESAGLLPR